MQTIAYAVLSTGKDETQMISGVGNGSSHLAAMEELRQKRFQKTDTDGDGKITRDELKAAIPDKGKGPGVDEIFTKVDTNQDGVIDQAEDTKAFQAMRKGPPHGHGGPPPNATEFAEKLFETADGDQDGQITLEDLNSMNGSEDSKSLLQRLFKAVDTDEDGSVSKTDLEKFLQQSLDKQRAALHSQASSGYDRTGTGMNPSSVSGFAVVA